MHSYKRYFSLLVIGLVLTTSTPFAFAATPANTPATNVNPSCEACSNTSPYIGRYVEFTDEIIKTMLTYANKETSVFKTATNNVDSTNGSTQTSTSTDALRGLESIVDNLNKKAQTAVSAGYVASLVTIEAGFLDSWRSIGPMLQNQAIMRDWTKLDTVGQKIMNTVLDLGNAGVFIRLGFKEGFQERINTIILSYSDGSNAIFTPIGGIKNFSYAPADILSAIRGMNQDLKTFIGVGGTNLENIYLKNQLQFSQVMRDSLVGINGAGGYYTCARWISGIAACSDLGNQAKESATAILNDTKQETKNAKKIVTDAMKRLTTFRAKNGGVNPDTKKRQDDYLRSVNGIQGVRNNDGIPLVEGFWESRKSVRDDISAYSPFAGLPGKSNKDKASPFLIGDIATQVAIASNSNTIEDAINDSLNIAQTNWKNSSFASVDPVTKTLPIITQEVMSASYKIESTNANSIIKSLGKACDAQCSNVGGRCWYNQ